MDWCRLMLFLSIYCCVFDGLCGIFMFFWLSFWLFFTFNVVFAGKSSHNDKNHPNYDWSFARLFSIQTNPKVLFPTLQNTLLQELCLQLAPSTGHALDVGCAVGRMTFGLSQHFQSVTGIDLSMAFIEAKRGEQKLKKCVKGTRCWECWGCLGVPH